MRSQVVPLFSRQVLQELLEGAWQQQGPVDHLSRKIIARESFREAGRCAAQRRVQPNARKLRDVRFSLAQRLRYSLHQEMAVEVRPVSQEPIPNEANDSCFRKEDSYPAEVDPDAYPLEPPHQNAIRAAAAIDRHYVRAEHL